MYNCDSAQKAETARHEQAALQLRQERDEATAAENAELKDCEKLNPNALQVEACVKNAQEKYRLADIEIKKKESDELTTYQNNLLRINAQCNPQEKCSDCSSCKTQEATQQHDQKFLQAQIEKNEFIGDERKAELDCSKMNPNSPQVQKCDQAASETARLRTIDNEDKVSQINKVYREELSSIAANCAPPNPSNHPSQWTDSYGEIHSWDDRYVYTDKNGRQWAFPLKTSTWGERTIEPVGTYYLDTDHSFTTDPWGNPMGFYKPHGGTGYSQRYGTQIN